MAAALVAAALFWVAPAYGEVLSAGSAPVVPDSYIVVLKDSARSLTRGGYSGKIGPSFGRVLNGFSLSTDLEGARRVAADPAVKYVQPNFLHPANGTQPSPPSWGLDRIDRNSRVLNSSYEYPNSADWVHVYIVDSGIHYDHDDFGGRAIPGWDFVNPGFDASDPCTGHGTHVAGTAGGTTYGVAKGVRLVSLRVIDCTGWSTTARSIEAANWLATTAIKPAVANLSYGNVTVDPAWEEAIRGAVASGVTYVVSSGSGDLGGNGLDACTVTPARMPEVIAVGATDRNDARFGKSGWGSCLDIFAPGVGITSAQHLTENGYVTWNGTSMAAPHVSGAAAIILGAHPSWTPDQVRHQLLNLDPTVVTVGGGGSGSPNKVLFVRSGPMRIVLSCSLPGGMWSCTVEANGAVGPNTVTWTPASAGLCLSAPKTVNVSVRVTDSLGATATASRTLLCKPGCPIGPSLNGSVPLICPSNVHNGKGEPGTARFPLS